MNFWKVLMESITAKQQQKGQNGCMGTQWFDVSQDTSKVVVPMAHPNQLETEVGVQEQPTVSTITEVVQSQAVLGSSVPTTGHTAEDIMKVPSESMKGDTMAQTQVSREGQAVVQAQPDGEDTTQLSVQAKDLVESESDQSNTISVLSGSVHCAVETFQKQRIKLIRDCQAMLAYGSAKTDLPQLEALQFLVEFHYIRHLRNNINHAADKTLVITSDMVKEAVSTLVSSLQAGQWLGTFTVESELENNRNII